jgi:hypothetical protein
MAKSRTITFHQPLGGIDRRAAYQHEEPYTLYDSMDCVPFDCKTSRRRLSTRPGWAILGDPTLEDCNLLATLYIAPSASSQKELLAAADGTLYKWDGTTFQSVGSGISTGRNVQAVSYLKKLYIANNGAPKVYTYGGSVATLTAESGLGTVPSNCRVIGVWNDRLLLGGDSSDDPHIMYASAQNNPRNWLYGEVDAGTAFASSEVDGGRIRDPIRAFIPHNHQCLLIAGATSIEVFVNNPMRGGSHRMVTGLAGIVCPTAWCRTMRDLTFMLTRKGVAVMPPGCGDIPELVSDRIPASLRAIDGVSRVAYLAHDVVYDGIHIHVTGETPEQWYFDITDKGFHRMTPPGTSVLAMHHYDPLDSATASGVLVGTAEGIFRWDSATPIGGEAKAYAVTNALRIGGSLGGLSMVKSARFAFSSNTDDPTGTVKMACAANAEAAVAMPADRSYSAPISSLGANREHFPRVGGQAMAVKIEQGDTTKHWSLEDGVLDLEPWGRER